MSDYHINIFYSDEDGGYIADIPDLESCSAFGDTAEQALAEVSFQNALDLAAVDRKQADDPFRPVPPPHVIHHFLERGF